MYDEGLITLLGFGIFGLTISIVYAVHRFLQRDLNWYSALGLAACLGTAFITHQMLNKKLAIVGASGERVVIQKKITRKKQETYYGKRTREMRYYLCYEDGEEVCVNVSSQVWHLQREGGLMPTVRLKGDDKIYHRSGIYTDNGNLSFDWYLRVFELLGALIFALKIIFPNFLLLSRFNQAENVKIFDE